MPKDSQSDFGLIPPRGTDPAMPPVSQPVARGTRGLAPWSTSDRYPVIVGQGLSLTYVANCLRTAISGYRQLLADLLAELLQKEPHGYAVIWKRILAVAGARLEIEEAKLPETMPPDHPDRALAKEIRDFVDQQIKQIPYFRTHLASLAWAVYYAVAAVEIHWDIDNDGHWIVKRLSFVHTRRLSYPDPQNWDLYIWDQGQVIGGYGGMGGSGWGAPTNENVFGLRIADYPAKFIVHAPQLRGDYPTREGLGIQVAEWFVLKRVAARLAPQYLERWSKPLMDVSYSTGADGKPRVADDKDIDEATSVAGALGAGSLSGWSHPDCIKVDPKYPDAGAKTLGYVEWLKFCNSEISKPIVGNTLTTEVGQGGGNRALGEVHESEELKINKHDAQCIDDTLQEQFIAQIVRLNYGPAAVRLAPRAKLHVEEPDAAALVELATKASRAGIAVDGDQVGEEVGLPLIPNESGKPRRMVPISDTNPAVLTGAGFPLILQKGARIVDPSEQLDRDAEAAEREAEAPTPTPPAGVPPIGGAPPKANGAPPRGRADGEDNPGAESPPNPN